MAHQLPLCFVLMPFNKKPAANGVMVDFDAVYADLIAPAIRAAGLEPLRADQESVGGLIHKPMFERLILCEYAVADLTTANANVAYELGLRHGIRPNATLLLFGQGTGPLPFDVAPLRALPYNLGADGKPAEVEKDLAAITQQLHDARTKTVDSPVYQLVEGFPDIQRLKTDVFRDRVDYANGVKARLAVARKQDKSAIDTIAGELPTGIGGGLDVEAGIAVDLLLSYRAVKAWDAMIALVPRLDPSLAATTLVQEQLGFALNRAGRADEAERVLNAVIARTGPSSETNGLLGRIHKDRWEAAVKAGDAISARGHLKRAIQTYLQGFEADWRDAYPGVNAVTLMELSDPPDPRRAALVPVVAYAVARRIASGKPDYWDHATRLELAILGHDEATAEDAAADALAAVRERWEPETTARNLRLIREARAKRGEVVAWADALEAALHARAAG
jgi:hypothetical protein